MDPGCGEESGNSEEVEEKGDTELNINCLPDESLVHVFSYLSHSELGSIARYRLQFGSVQLPSSVRSKKWQCTQVFIVDTLPLTSFALRMIAERYQYCSLHLKSNLLELQSVCKRWHELTKHPFLWKKVTVQYQKSGKQKKSSVKFFEILPVYVTHFKLKFVGEEDCFQRTSLKFDVFCLRLAAKCPYLKILILQNMCSTISLQSVIDLCRQYLQNLEVLSIHNSNFTDMSVKADYSDFSKIKILDFFLNLGVAPFTVTFSKMTNLKKLNLAKTGVNDSWFEDDTSFLHNLDFLNLQWAWQFGSKTFQILKNNASKLNELYLCFTKVNDSDFSFPDSIFPHLKTICINGCLGVTCEGVISLLSSCPSLQNVYVKKSVAESYAAHPFIVDNESKLQVVKTIDKCLHYSAFSYLYSE